MEEHLAMLLLFYLLNIIFDIIRGTTVPLEVLKFLNVLFKIVF